MTMRDVPLYLVRWPDLSGAFVNASNEEALFDILDEVANPEGCTWSIYRGPLHIEFQLNATLEFARENAGVEVPVDINDVRIGNVEPLRQGEPLSFAVPVSDTGEMMTDAILRKTFPALQALRKTLEGEPATEEQVVAALRDDLNVLVKASWRQHQTKRRPDRDSRIAAMMGTAPALVARWAQDARAAEQRAPSPTKPRSRKGKRPVKQKKPPARPPRR